MIQFNLRALLVTACLLVLMITTHSLGDVLDEQFRDPPESAKPTVWWHWMGPNFSKEGITRDLEAMKESGVGGATIFNISSAVMESQMPTENNPWPENTYRSEKYWQALRHAASEAKRLGLKIGLHNTVGYSTTGGPWIDHPQAMKKVAWTITEMEGGKEIHIALPPATQPVYRGWGGAAKGKSDFYRDIGIVALPADKQVVAKDEVIDLTTKCKAGELSWSAPPGKWKIYRFGYVPTGATPHPLPDDVIGKCLEADKINIEASRFHWSQVIDPVKLHLGDFVGQSFDHMLIDSYEAGFQNWTDGFREIFIQRRGYDPLPWLATLGPAVTGEKPKAGKTEQTIENKELSARFQYDLRSLVSELYYENGFAVGRDALHKVGLHLYFEPYSGPFDTIECTPLADLPMGEFWTGNDGRINPSVVAAARAVGRTIIGAESFTGAPARSKWSETPADLKHSCDGTFISGVNRITLHHWVHQPFDDRYQPGMGMGWWGTHFGRNQTWFEPGKEFFSYIARCQALLQRGQTPVDFVSVGATAGGDAISWRIFRSDIKVQNGKIVLPGGRQYEFLHVPHNGAMLPEDLKHIQKLLTQGASIVCKKPEHSPSMHDYPQCDNDVKTLADKLWGNQSADAVQVGPGTLFTHGDAGKALAALRIETAVRILSTPQPKGVHTIHRRDGQTDIFFIANQDNQPTTFTMSFAVSGKTPELWDAERKTIRPASNWRENAGRAELELELLPDKSLFVIFRSASKLPQEASTNTGKPMDSKADVQPIDGPWKVELKSRVEPLREIELKSLSSLAESDDKQIKYFSGTATYRTSVELSPSLQGKRINLDLGKVADMAGIRINGKNLGVLWHGPFVLDISSAVVSGKNDIEIAVTNTWHNRLVGDEQEPVDFEWGGDRGADRGRMMKGYPDWFLKGLARPSTGRKCFVIWYYHRPETKLLPSGLIGPVKLDIKP